MVHLLGCRDRQTDCLHCLNLVVAPKPMNRGMSMSKAKSAEFDTSAIRQALAREDYDTVITEVRAAVKADPMAAMADPVIADWMGRRYRNIFIEEALRDDTAIKHAQAPFPLDKIDRRTDRKKIANRYIKGIDDDEATVEMPLAEEKQLTDVTFVFCPGLLTGLLPVLAFQSVWPQMTERFGIRIISSDSHPMRSSKANVADLENAIEKGIGFAPVAEPTLMTGDDAIPVTGDIVLMGYSKGSPDLLTLLVERPDLAPRIRAVIGWAGAVGGSYLADDILETLKGMPGVNSVGALTRKDVIRQVMRLAPVAEINNINRRIEEFDLLGAVEGLTTGFRDNFNQENLNHFAELGVPQFYFTGATSLMDVPYFQRQGTIKLDVYDQDNDMQLTQAQAAFPGPNAVKLAMFNGNHWDLSYDAFPWQRSLGSRHLQNKFTRTSAAAAIMLMFSELGILE